MSRSADDLVQTAERVLHSSCGPNMLTWFIGNHPVGHYVYKIKNLARISQSVAPAAESSPPTPASNTPSSAAIRPTPTVSLGEKTFFMKSRILRGQVDPTHDSNIKSAETDIEDFQWLSKEEIRDLVSEQYWATIKNMLLDQ